MNNKETINIYLAIYCNINGAAMSYSYLVVNSTGECIFDTTNAYPTRFENSLLGAFDLALNDLDFDLINGFYVGQEIPAVINIITNFQPAANIFNNSILIESKFKNIHKFKETKARFESDFCAVNFSFSSSDESLMDREYQCIKDAIILDDKKTFYDYSLKDFKYIVKADRPAFMEMIRLNGWDKIRSAKGTEQMDKIAYVQGLLNVGKKETIKRTLDLFGGFN